MPTPTPHALSPVNTANCRITLWFRGWLSVIFAIELIATYENRVRARALFGLCVAFVATLGPALSPAQAQTPGQPTTEPQLRMEADMHSADINRISTEADGEAAAGAGRIDLLVNAALDTKRRTDVPMDDFQTTVASLADKAVTAWLGSAPDFPLAIK